MITMKRRKSSRIRKVKTLSPVIPSPVNSDADEDQSIEIEQIDTPPQSKGSGKSFRLNLGSPSIHRRTAGGGKYSQYDFENVVHAFEAVKKEKMTIREASEKYGIPQTTLRDRVTGRVSLTAGRRRNRKPPILTTRDERRVVEYLLYLDELGYAYSREKIRELATDLAIQIGRRNADDRALSNKWLLGFYSRWPEVRNQKVKKLSELSERALNEDSIEKYYMELDALLFEHDLLDKPDHIFFVLESCIHSKMQGLWPDKNLPPRLRPKNKCVTVLSSGNAVGSSVPPYIVFPGRKMSPTLLEGSLQGTNGTSTLRGRTNFAVFNEYVKTHLQTYLPNMSDERVLVLYDAHSSHVTLSVLDKARQHNMILFPLPPHFSAIRFQPEPGVSVVVNQSYGDEILSRSSDIAGAEHLYRQVFYDEAWAGIVRARMHTIRKYDIGRLCCRAYERAWTPANLTAAFRDSGIFPLDPNVIPAPPTELVPSIVPPKTQPPVDSSAYSSSKNKKQSKTKMSFNRVKSNKSGKNVNTDADHDYRNNLYTNSSDVQDSYELSYQSSNSDDLSDSDDDGMPPRNKKGRKGLYGNYDHKKQYHQYSQDAMAKAYKAVTKKRYSVTKAAKIFDVPTSTLRDRVNANSPNKPRSNNSLFTADEERKLVKHAYSCIQSNVKLQGQQLRQLGTSLAVYLGKCKKTVNIMSSKWLNNFYRRWPEIKHMKCENSNRPTATALVEALNPDWSKY